MSPEKPERMDSEQKNAIALSDEVERALSFQEYVDSPRIHDVELTSIRKHRADNGWFAELLKIDVSGAVEQGRAKGMRVRQVSASYADPGRINAFHLHPREVQNELWAVLAGSLVVWLVDCRKGSPSEGTRQRIVLSGEDPSQLYIPAGVAHGYRAGREGALLVYMMDQQFQRERPNEGRLPWDFFGEELWAEDRG